MATFDTSTWDFTDEQLCPEPRHKLYLEIDWERQTVNLVQEHIAIASWGQRHQRGFISRLRMYGITVSYLKLIWGRYLPAIEAIVDGLSHSTSGNAVFNEGIPDRDLMDFEDELQETFPGAYCYADVDDWMESVPITPETNAEEMAEEIEAEARMNRFLFEDGAILNYIQGEIEAQILERIEEEENEDVAFLDNLTVLQRMRIACDVGNRDEVMEALVNDEETIVQIFLALNPYAPYTVHNDLSSSASRSVLFALIYNPNLPKTILKRLCNSNYESVATAAQDTYDERIEDEKRTPRN